MSTPESSLHGRVALVTGGSRGLGRAICIHLARAGCSHICVNYNKNEDAAQQTRELVLQAAPQAQLHLYQCDVSEPEPVAAMIRRIEQETGSPVSVLVNNAGISSIREISEVTLDDFDTMWKTNTRSAFIVTQAVQQQMQQQRFGRIIFMTSIAAYTGGVTGPHYAASKAGMIGLCNSYAQRLVKFGVTSNAVSPGLVASDMMDAMIAKIGKDRVIANTQPGRLGHPDEVAAVVCMLAQNGYVNGQVIGVDGGIHKK